jgi:Zn-dependent protease with chaperone function
MPVSLSLVLVLASTAAAQPDEPHPFPREQLTTYEALSRRLDAGDRTAKAEAKAFLEANPGNPRSHYLVGVALLLAGDTGLGRQELELALEMGIRPAKRRGGLLAILAKAWIPDDKLRAYAYATEALRLLPERTDLLRLLAQLDLEYNFAAARPKFEEIARRSPDDGDVQAELAILRWKLGDHPGAMDAVRRATSLGVTRPFFSTLESMDRRERWSKAGVIGLAVALVLLWVGLGLIALAGSLLSRTELGALADVKSRLDTGVRTAQESRIERAYGAVVLAAIVLLVVALPVLLAVTIGVTVGVVWLMFQIHVTFPFVILLLILGAGATTWGILRALFIRLEPPGKHALTRADEPRLYALLDEVAEVAHSAPVREVVIGPGPNIGVLERGSTLAVLLGRGVRVLALGYAGMQALTIGELRAILAHEYGHFSHGETRLVPVICRVQLVSFLMLQGVSRSGWMAYLNPAFWFLRAFLAVFHGLNSARDRRRELLADRIAALAYGGDAFERALSTVTYAAQDLERTVALLLTLRAMGLAQDGLYGLQELKRRDFPPPLRRAIERDRPTSPYDSHPPNEERIERIRGIQGRIADDGSPALELLSDPGRLATEMSAELLGEIHFPDPTLPLPPRPLEEVVPALSHLLDATELANREPREALRFVESSVAEASEVLGPEHPVLRQPLMRLSDLRQGNGDRAGADEAIQRARRIVAKEPEPEA